MPVVIGVMKGDEFACRHFPAYVARAGGTDISGQRNDPDPVGAVSARKFMQQLQGAIAAAIIHKQNFKGLMGLCFYRGESALYGVATTIAGNNDANRYALLGGRYCGVGAYIRAGHDAGRMG